MKSYEIYQKLGININIFFDTFKCITRFIEECKFMNNEEYFDRDFWVYRQISLQEFRLGQLEYEYVEKDGKKYVSIHIPSDAVLTKENIDESLELFKEFTNKYYPQYNDVEANCYSWLLSPVLETMLDKNSRILLFKKYFDIVKYDEDKKDYICWLFKVNENTKVIDYPESTSLQKKMKKHLLNGGKSGNGFGILKKY